MKHIFKFFLVLAFCFGALGVLSDPVSAQGGCQDASGGPIPCPTEEPEDNNNSKKATPTPVPPTRAPSTDTPTSTPTNTPEPTPTSLPEIAAPNEEPGTGKAEWSGVCKDSTCIAQFTNGCESVGGTVETGEIKDGQVPLTCKVPMEEYEPEIVLAAAPTEEPDSRKAEWSGTCKDTTCIAQFTNGCKSVGGTVDIGKIEEGTVPLTCKVPMEEYEPEIAIAAAPSDPQPEPRPNGGFPPGGWLPWITGLSGLLIGLLLPAVQKVREAAPRAGQTREHVLLNKEDDGNTELERAGILNLTDKPDGGSTDHKDWIHIESMSHEPDSGASSGAMPQTKEHVLLNKDDKPQADDEPTIKNKEEDGSTEAAFMKLGDIKGESKD